MIDINLKQLEAFVSTADCASFTRAAEELFLTQSTVSSHISALEQQLNWNMVLRQSPQGESKKVPLRFLTIRCDLITEIILRERIQTDIAPCILHFMITVQDATWRCSFGQRIWMTLRKSALQIILAMKRNRNTKEQEEMPYRRENASILMKPMNETSNCSSLSFLSWM